MSGVPVVNGDVARRRSRLRLPVLPHDLDDGSDLSRGRSAASSDDRHPGIDELTHIAHEVVGVDRVLEPGRTDAAGEPGVRLGGQRHRRVPAELADDGQAALRTERAVRPQSRDRLPGYRPGEVGRRVPAQHPLVLGERGLGDHRHAEVGRHVDGLRQLVQVAERLQHQQVDTGSDEQFHLLTQCLGALARADPPALVDADRGRHRARDQHRAARPCRRPRARSGHPRG